MKPIISPNSRIRHPEHFEIGAYSILDDYCYVSTRVRIGIASHVASGCSIAGGKDHCFTLGDFSSLSSGVRIWCASNDFVNDLVMIALPGLEVPECHPIEGDVTLGDYTGVGSNAIVMPGAVVPEGTVVGSLSLVPAGTRLQPWSVYAGVPVRYIKPRNRENVLAQVARIRSWLGDGVKAK